MIFVSMKFKSELWKIRMCTRLESDDEDPTFRQKRDFRGYIINFLESVWYIDLNVGVSGVIGLKY